MLCEEGSAAASKPKLNFIWHTAFCCSTLISRILDLPGRNLSLREPAILMRLVEAKRASELGRHLPSNLPEAVFGLLSQPYRKGATVTVKPTNAANYLLPDAAHGTSGKMLFLYSDCRSFLISLAKRSLEGSRYGRELFATIAGDGNDQYRWSMQALFMLSDLEIAALAWQMQMAEFRRAFANLDQTRFVSLNSDDFAGAPASVLSQLDSFFELDLGSGHVETATQRLSVVDAKLRSSSFDLDRHQAERDALAKQLGTVLDEVVSWSYEVCKSQKIASLPNQLIPGRETSLSPAA